MPAKKSVAVAVTDSSGEDEINVNRVVETKKELDEIRKEREKKRAQLQADLDKKLDDLRACVKRSLIAHTQQLGGIHQQQVSRLLQAVEARDRILRAIGDKLAVVQDEGDNLAIHLSSAYEYRMKKARSFPVAAEDLLRHRDKKAKVETA